MSKIKNGGLDQYDPKPSEQQQLGTAGVERVNLRDLSAWYQRLFVTMFRGLAVLALTPR